MKGFEEKLLQYMEGSKKRFVIPVYQRNYDWRKEQCKQLYDDLVRIEKQGKKSHFFGSLVSVYNPDGHQDEFLIIDGQQRLTTVSLLLLAMYNLITEGKVEPKVKHLGQQIYEEYLVDKWQPEETRVKLKPIKNDQAAYQQLIDGGEHLPASNLTLNYLYFYDRIQQTEVTVDELFSALSKLEVINISLNADDNPQLIFESLNSTGLDLNEGDKIRNFILMGLTSKQQEKYYDSYWNKIEEYTAYDVSSFVRDYLSVKTQSTPNVNCVYTKFKEYAQISGAGTEELLDDMLANAKRYGILLNKENTLSGISACIYRLNRLKTTVTRPFFLEVLRMKDEALITADETKKVFLLVEDYLFRRTICDVPTNALNKIFIMLHKDIVGMDGSTENYLEKCKYVLCSKKESGRFPNDEEFAQALSTKSIYGMRGESKTYLFERLENAGSVEVKDVWTLLDKGTYSIEHIMPQHLTAAWEECEPLLISLHA